MDGIQYRHEWKHEISYADLLAIRQRLRVIARADPHARDGKYLIRSLYFDNPEDKALREKIDGVNRREKFRIRCYNGDSSLIHLEKKSRLNGLGTKFSARLTAEEAQRIVDGNLDWMMDPDRPLLQELYCKMRYQGLRPKTIVDYTRRAFVYAPGNTRITLDDHVRTGLSSLDFFNPSLPTIPADITHPIILEVKYDRYLPDAVRRAIRLDNRRTTNFSKYAACRLTDF